MFFVVALSLCLLRFVPIGLLCVLSAGELAWCLTRRCGAAGLTVGRPWLAFSSHACVVFGFRLEELDSDPPCVLVHGLRQAQQLNPVLLRVLGVFCFSLHLVHQTILCHPRVWDTSEVAAG